MLRALGVPVAASWAELQSVPARLVSDVGIVAGAVHDAEEWRALDAQQKAKK